jgi:hypothetical protein
MQIQRSKIEVVKTPRLFFKSIPTGEYNDLNKYLDMSDRIKSDAKDPFWAFDFPEPTRSKLLYTLGASSYGFRHQNLLVYESSGLLSAVSSLISRGDSKTTSDKHCEFKVSYTSKVGSYCFLQVRLWQDIDCYIFKVIDRSDNYSIKYFCFTRKQVEEEYFIQKPKATHGDKKVTSENLRIELSFRYNPKNSLEKDRWEDLYLQEDVFSWLKKL